jgi:hypothetical protein
MIPLNTIAFAVLAVTVPVSVAPVVAVVEVKEVMRTKKEVFTALGFCIPESS